MFKTIKKIIRLWNLPDPQEHRFELYINGHHLLSMPFLALMLKNELEGKKHYELKLHDMVVEAEI